jgi:hypothetical protein
MVVLFDLIPNVVSSSKSQRQSPRGARGSLMKSKDYFEVRNILNGMPQKH